MFSYFFDSVFGNFWMFLEGFKDLWVIECFKLNLTLRSAQVRTCALHLMQASNYIVAAVSLKLYSLDEDKNTMNFKNGSTVNKRIHNLLDITLVQVSLLLFSLIIVRTRWPSKLLRKIIRDSAQKNVLTKIIWFHLGCKWSKSTKFFLEDIDNHNLNQIQVFCGEDFTRSWFIGKQTISS